MENSNRRRVFTRRLAIPICDHLLFTRRFDVVFGNRVRTILNVSLYFAPATRVPKRTFRTYDVSYLTTVQGQEIRKQRVTNSSSVKIDVVCFCLLCAYFRAYRVNIEYKWFFNDWYFQNILSMGSKVCFRSFKVFEL